MAPRLPLEKLCKSKYILEYQPDAIHRVLKADSARLFTNLSTRIFHHADQHGRDTILRALSLSAAHLELDKLFSPLRDADVSEIFRILALFKFERVQEDPGDLQSAQDAAFSSVSSPENYEGYSTTPDPAEMRITEWISDQKNLRSEHDRRSEHAKNRKRRHSDITSDECDSSHAGSAILEPQIQEEVAIRRQPKRSGKITRATQSAIQCGERELRTRKVPRSEAPQRSTRGIPKSTTRGEGLGSTPHAF
ncbi:MAG: hypothetical protein LQ344_007054 [Seirophora lacunosa]|nr:MAG: hypothetical protein LQ344_007054 [Seirophora lacunosa]